jgi:segregation and condensation protein B
MTGPDDLMRAVEALVFASEVPLAADDIARRLEVEDVTEALASIAARHAGQGIELVERGGRWHFQTAADLAHLLRETRESTRRLSRAGVETLAIIAYHEPVSRAEIEAIRGVQISKGTIDVLIEAGWIAPAGRRQLPGRPLTYATTADFLSHFGLADRRDLPGIDDLRAAGLLDPMGDDWDVEINETELESADESD